jgi:hypothetical protein
MNGYMQLQIGVSASKVFVLKSGCHRSDYQMVPFCTRMTMRAYNCGEVPALLLVISIDFNCDGCKYLYNLQRWYAYFTNGGYDG